MPDDSTHVIRRAAILALTILAVVGGCLKPPVPSPSDPISAARVVLTVRNNSRTDLTLNVVSDGQPVRVGAATAATTTSLEVPARLFGQGRELRLHTHLT